MYNILYSLPFVVQWDLTLAPVWHEKVVEGLGIWTSSGLETWTWAWHLFLVILENILSCLTLIILIICRQQASDTENPIWIIQLIRSFTLTNPTRQQQQRNVSSRKKILYRTFWTNLRSSTKTSGFIVEISGHIFPTEPRHVRITTQSDLYQTYLTESHWTWLLVKKTLIHWPKTSQAIYVFIFHVCKLKLISTISALAPNGGSFKVILWDSLGFFVGSLGILH